MLAARFASPAWLGRTPRHECVRRAHCRILRATAAGHGYTGEPSFLPCRADSMSFASVWRRLRVGGWAGERVSVYSPCGNIHSGWRFFAYVATTGCHRSPSSLNLSTCDRVALAVPYLPLVCSQSAAAVLLLQSTGTQLHGSVSVQSAYCDTRTEGNVAFGTQCRTEGRYRTWSLRMLTADTAPSQRPSSQIDGARR